MMMLTQAKAAVSSLVQASHNKLDAPQCEMELLSAVAPPGVLVRCRGWKSVLRWGN